MCVNDMAVAYDGSTIYLISDGVLERSTNSGITFFRIPLPPKCILPLLNVAVAPDDKYVIAVSDSRCNGNAFFASTNGGRTWSTFRRPKTGPLTVTDIAISPMRAGYARYYMVSVADNRPGSTALGDVLTRKSNTPYFLPWGSVGGVQGSHDYMAIQASPNFASDESICVVGAKPSAGVDYQLISLNTNSVMHTVNFIPASTRDFTSYYSRTFNSILSADIALSPDFLASDDAMRTAFISIASNNSPSSDGVYRINHTHARGIKLNMGMKSVAFDGNILLAGQYNRTRVWRSKNPMAVAPIFRTVRPLRPGQWEALVRMGGTAKYLGTSGLEGSFFSI